MRRTPAAIATRRRSTCSTPASSTEDRYFDVDVIYSKAGPEEIHLRITAHNRGPEAAPLHLLPTLWFRNTWSWGDAGAKPRLRSEVAPAGASWAVRAEHPQLGAYYLYGRQPAEPLFTENDSNAQRCGDIPTQHLTLRTPSTAWSSTARRDAVNPEGVGTQVRRLAQLQRFPPVRRCASISSCPPKPLTAPFARSEVIFASRQSEADGFYDDLLPEASPEDHAIMRQALAGMIWCKQFFHYDVERWLKGDSFAAAREPPAWAAIGSGSICKAGDVISMPDSWEYPWFAAWDLAFHCGALALVDVDFAKDQIELMLSDRYLHPNGQIPAYEWNFSDVNPPVHALGALKAFRAERVQRGQGDRGFLQRVFHKLLLNYTWWINRKDADGHNVFEGGFLGLDNISVIDRSQPLPPGYSLKQADATGWVAMFALNMTVMALELAVEDPDYENIAIQTYEQFLAIANAIGGHVDGGVSLWDAESRLLQGPDRHPRRPAIIASTSTRWSA